VGIIIFTLSKEIPSPSGGRKGYFKRLYTTNWRVMTSCKNVDRIAVVMHNFKLFEIYSITVEEFLSNNFTQGNIKKPFKYSSSLLSCGICYGSGRVDWIRKAMSRGASLEANASVMYRRDPNHISKFEPLSEHKDIIKVIYGSVPRLIDGNELCSNCKGTGVNSIRLVKYMEE
jgi:hypothetical protein